MMTLPVSLVLIAAGAILIWGVTTDAEGLDLDAIGVILIVVGIVGLILSVLFWDRWRWGAWGGRRRTYVESEPGVRRRAVVEEDVEQAPPAGPPPP
jgi:hypothetical protein